MSLLSSHRQSVTPLVPHFASHILTSHKSLIHRSCSDDTMSLVVLFLMISACSGQMTTPAGIRDCSCPEMVADVASDEAHGGVTTEDPLPFGFPETSRVKRRVTSMSDKFKKLTHLVRISKLEDCAGRTVCELNCNADAFGSDGKRVLHTMNKLQQSGYVAREDMEFYIKAAVVGRKGMGKKNECHKLCQTAYPVCPAETKDLVAVASLIKLHSM